MAAFQHHVLHIVNKVRQMERVQFFRPADAPGLDRVIDHTRGFERIKRRCDDTGCGGQLAQLLRKLGLTHDQAVDVHLDRAPRHLGLVAADDDGVLPGKEQILILLRKRDGYLAAHPVNQVPGFIDDLAVEHV